MFFNVMRNIDNNELLKRDAMSIPMQFVCKPITDIHDYFESNIKTRTIIYIDAIWIVSVN